MISGPTRPHLFFFPFSLIKPPMLMPLPLLPQDGNEGTEKATNRVSFIFLLGFDAQVAQVRVQIMNSSPCPGLHPYAPYVIYMSILDPSLHACSLAVDDRTPIRLAGQIEQQQQRCT